MATPITGNETFWGGLTKPTAATLALINSSPTLVQELNDYQAAVDNGKALPFSINGLDTGTLNTVPNSLGQLRIDVGTSRNGAYQNNQNNIITDLSYELGKYESYQNDQALYESLLLSPNDPSFSAIATSVAILAERQSFANNAVVQREIYLAQGVEIGLNGEGTAHANGALQSIADSVYAGSSSGSPPADYFSALVDASSGVMGNFPAVPNSTNSGYLTFTQLYSGNVTGVNQFFRPTQQNLINPNFGLNGSEDLTNVSVNYNSSANTITSTTMYFSDGTTETLNFSNSQISTAVYYGSTGSIASTITYTHNSDGSYSATMSDGTGAVVSTQNISSSGTETQTFTNPSSTADVNASGITLTTNANTIDVNGADYDTTILNGNHVINAQAGDTFQLAGVGYNVNLSETGAASTVTFEANSGGTVNGSAVTVDVLGSGGAIAIGGNGQNASGVGIDHINFENNVTGSVTEGGNANIDVAGNDVALAIKNNDTANMNGSGDTVYVSGTGDGVFISHGTLYGQNGDAFAVNGSNDWITDGMSSSTTINGSNDTLGSLGNGSAVSVQGQGDAIDGSGSTIYGKDSDSITVNGSSDTITDGANSSTVINGSNDTLASLGSGSAVSIQGQIDIVDGSDSTIYGQNNDVVTVNGSGDLITDGMSSSTTINGSNDTLGSLGNGSAVSVQGQGDAIDGSGSTIYGKDSDSITVNGSSDTITDGANSSTVINGSNDTLASLGSGSAVSIQGQSDIVDGSDSTIYGQNNDVFTVNGSGDLITDGMSSSTTINGSNDTLGSLGNGSAVSVQGQGDAIDGSGSTIYGKDSDSITVNGSSDTITDGTSSTTNVNGSNDTLSYIGSGSTVDVFGQSDTIDLLSNSGTLVNFSGDSSGTVTGAGDTIDLTGNDITVYANNDTIDHVGEISGDIVDGSGDTGAAGVSGLNYVDDDGGDPLGDSGGDDLPPSDEGGDEGDPTASLGFAGDRQAINAELSGGATQLATLEQAQGLSASAVNRGLAQATEMSTHAATSAGNSANVLEGARWSDPTITWSLNTTDGAFNQAEQSQIEQAFSTWAAASGLQFVEVASSTQADINIGWGSLDTSQTGAVGLTTYNKSKGQFSVGTRIQLESSSQDALTAGSSGSLIYSGTDATFSQTVLHEIGHALGLAENADTTSIMNYDLTSSNRTLDQTDLNAIHALYGSSAQTAALIQAMAGMPPSASSTTSLPAEQASQHVQLLAGAH